MGKWILKRRLFGVSLRKRNLDGQDYRGQDIRSFDFSGSSLQGADFSNAICGQSAFWLLAVTLVVLLFALVTGIVFGFAGASAPVYLIEPISQNEATTISIEYFQASSLLAFIFLGFISWLIFYRGYGSVINAFLITLTAGLVLSIWSQEREFLTAWFLQSFSIAAIIAGIILGALSISISICIGKKIIYLAISLLGLMGFLIGIYEGFLSGEFSASGYRSILVILGMLTVLFAFLSIITAIRAMVGDPRYSFIRTLAISISSWGGTKFVDSDLTNANFSNANLQQTNLKNANLKRTCWFGAQKLSRANLKQTYLENLRIQSLVVTKDGKEKTFNRLNLSALNLENSNLEKASLIGCNLSESNLRGTNLSHAKLAEAQFYSSDLRNAVLTGAFIENWGISTDTQLTGIECDCIYMRLPTEQDPDPCRKPDNRNESFRPGDFEDFITPIVKTLELYQDPNIDLRDVASTYRTIDLFHHDGIDPKAAVLALQNLVEQRPESGLEIIALEGRGQNKIRLQAKVSSHLDRSALSQEYFEAYERFQNLPYADLQSLLNGVVEKDEQIQRLENLLERTIQQPRFYVETIRNQGEFTMSDSRGSISVNSDGGNISGLSAAGGNQHIVGSTLGQVSGSVTNTIEQLSSEGLPNGAELKRLLLALKTAFEEEGELSEEDKVEALEQIDTLAEAAQKPEDSGLKKAAKTAMKILRGTTAGVSETTNLVEACSSLLPAIAGLLALI